MPKSYLGGSSITGFGADPTYTRRSGPKRQIITKAQAKRIAARQAQQAKDKPMILTKKDVKNIPTLKPGTVAKPSELLAHRNRLIAQKRNKAKQKP